MLTLRSKGLSRERAFFSSFSERAPLRVDLLFLEEAGCLEEKRREEKKEEDEEEEERTRKKKEEED